ncbi:MAG: Flp pilus assembly complex ATPase component TadA [Desulfobulbaceae bacterium]|nr:Flp pilus assembly complex ATPase component TadA [Desulfobulbaceae bacterium]
MSHPSFFRKTKKLGELLVDSGKIQQNHLERALSHKSNVPHNLGYILVSLGFINDMDLTQALSEQLSLSVYEPAPEDEFQVFEVSKMFHREHPFAFVKRGEDNYLLLLDNPFDEDILAAVDVIVDIPYEVQMTSESRIRKILDEHYGLSFDEVAEEGFAGENSDIDKLKDMASEAPVIKYVNNLIDTAVNQRASDIHMEPFEDGLRIRFRIDGILYDYEIPPLSMQAAIISRTKLLAALDIAERRLPQDGKISVRISGKEVDLRVSTLPTVYGEGVVIRILEQASIIIDMSHLGMQADIEKQFKKIISLSDGIMLVTGPTGSGKTTTLYCALNFINSESNKIITIEDPVEYQLRGINQIQVKAEIGLTFAAGLRSIVRQDPDVIMIGEIRDLETAEIAVQSSLTGHLVFSTLHTNDAVSAVIRLIDIGVESFLISSSLRGVLAQRLVRRICPACREARGNVSEFLGHKPDGEDFQLFEGKGCQQCSKTGYSGRIGIYEILTVSEAVSRGISQGLDLIGLKRIAEQEGLKTMFMDGLEKVKEGGTTFSELIRVTRGLEDGAL